MTTRLTRHGDGLALIIDRPMLDLLNIDAETPLEISTDGEKLVVAPVRDEERLKAFRDALAHANERYGDMLERLAK